MMVHFTVLERFVDTNRVIKRRKAKKGSQYNGQKITDKGTDQTIIYKTHYTETKRSSNTNPTKTGGEQFPFYMWHSCYKPDDGYGWGKNRSVITHKRNISLWSFMTHILNQTDRGGTLCSGTFWLFPLKMCNMLGCRRYVSFSWYKSITIKYKSYIILKIKFYHYWIIPLENAKYVKKWFVDEFDLYKVYFVQFFIFYNIK